MQNGCLVVGRTSSVRKILGSRDGQVGYETCPFTRIESLSLDDIGECTAMLGPNSHNQIPPGPHPPGYH